MSLPGAIERVPLTEGPSQEDPRHAHKNNQTHARFSGYSESLTPDEKPSPPFATTAMDATIAASKSCSATDFIIAWTPSHAPEVTAESSCWPRML